MWPSASISGHHRVPAPHFDFLRRQRGGALADCDGYPSQCTASSANVKCATGGGRRRRRTARRGRTVSVLLLYRPDKKVGIVRESVYVPLNKPQCGGVRFFRCLIILYKTPKTLHRHSYHTQPVLRATALSAAKGAAPSRTATDIPVSAPPLAPTCSARPAADVVGGVPPAAVEEVTWEKHS